MNLSEIRKADLSVIYNTEEFAKKAIYKTKEIAVLFHKDDVNIFDVPFERIKGLESDFLEISEGDEIEIEGILYSIMNYERPKDFQILISIKGK